MHNREVNFIYHIVFKFRYISTVYVYVHFKNHQEYIFFNYHKHLIYIQESILQLYPYFYTNFKMKKKTYLKKIISNWEPRVQFHF